VARVRVEEAVWVRVIVAAVVVVAVVVAVVVVVVVAVVVVVVVVAVVIIGVRGRVISRGGGQRVRTIIIIIVAVVVVDVVIGIAVGVRECCSCQVQSGGREMSLLMLFTSSGSRLGMSCNWHPSLFFSKRVKEGYE
jgi:hypothetical protein